MRKTLSFLAGCSFFLFSCGQDTDRSTAVYQPKETRSSHSLGDRTVEIIMHQFGDRNDIIMLSLHDDETSSVLAARRVLEQTGGMLIRIENNNKRLIQFTNKGKSFLFDPNRMFTLAGIKASLLKHNKVSPAPAITAIHHFGLYVLNQIPANTTTLIALHNNDEGRLTIDSYDAGGDYEKDVNKVSKNTGADPDNFFLTTDKQIYGMLKDSFNVVLQDNERATDDGSLSVYYGRKKKSYVNVEAGIGQVKEQEEMIRALLNRMNATQKTTAIKSRD